MANILHILLICVFNLFFDCSGCFTHRKCNHGSASAKPPPRITCRLVGFLARGPASSSRDSFGLVDVYCLLFANLLHNICLYVQNFSV